jgi:putative phage-type endonuclease
MIQDGEDWLAWRRAGIGGSDAAAILGVSPWKTAHQVWLEKTGRLEPLVTAAMQRGKDLEPIARRAYEARTELIVQPGTFTHPAWPVMRCSVDGITLDGACVLEVKCPGLAGHASAVAGTVPDYYVPQCQHILAVTQAKVLHYWSYCPEAQQPTVLLEVFPASAYIADLMEAERRFWRYVESNTPPPLTEQEVMERTDREWLEAAELYRAAEAKVVEHTAQKEAARQLLDQLAGPAVRVAGGGITLTRYTMEGRVDYRAIPELRGVNLDQYRKKGTAAFRISVEKEE